jgi:DNA-binding transcriptional MerR regulator
MHLSITAISMLVGKSGDVLRRAERLGLIPRADRTVGGHRRWRVEDLPAIRRALLRERGTEEAEGA